MEKVIHYTFSKTKDKSLSYLSGVGYDLSFDITYYLRISSLAARYFDGALFLSKDIIGRLDKHIDFGEQTAKMSNIKSHNENVFRNVFNSIFFVKPIIDTERYRVTSIYVEKKDYMLRTYKYLDLHETYIFSYLDPKHEIEDHDTMFQFIPNIRNLLIDRDMLAELIAKNGLTLDKMQDMLSGKNYKDVTSESELFAEENGCNRIDAHDTLSVNLKTKELSFDDVIGVNTLSTTIDIDKQFLVDTDDSTLQINSDIINVGKTDLALHDKEEWYVLKLRGKELSNYKPYTNISSRDKKIFIDSTTCYETEEPEIYTLDYNTIGIGDKGLLYENIQQQLETSDKGATQTEGEWAFTPEKSIFSYGQELVNKPSSGIFSYNQELIQKPSSGILNTIEESVSKPPSGLFDNSTSEYIGKESSGAWWEDPYYSTSKTLSGLFNLEYENMVSKTYYGTQDLEKIINISKFRTGVGGDDAYTYVFKTSNSVADINANVFFMQKNTYGTMLIDNIDVSKAHFNTSVNARELLAERLTSYGTYTGRTLALIKDDKDVFCNGVVLFALRNTYKGVHSDERIYSISKKYNDTYILPSLEFTRSIKRDVVISSTGEFIYKTGANVFEYETYFSIAKSEFGFFDSDDSFSISKVPSRVDNMLDTVCIDKSSIPIMMKDLNEYIYKMPKGIEDEHETVFANKNYRPYLIQEFSEYITKAPKGTGNDVEDLIVTKNRNRPIRSIGTQVGVYPDEYSIENIDLSVYFVPRHRLVGIENTILTFSMPYNASIHDVVFLKRPILRSSFLDNDLFIKGGDTRDASINYGDFLERPIRYGNIEDHNNFAYVEKIDYALIKDDRVDELELPKSDFDYSTFAKKLVIDGQINPAYIKRYDNETGYPIVNLPVENPMKYFSDLATHYIDLNVGMLTYIIEKAYNIWQNNIFTYSAMSSNGALNDILIKLKDGLFIQYPSEKDQEHLHRAIRLFRWYAEMSILNNADYMVKLNYKDKSVDYMQKDLTEFLSIADIENLHIDNTYVLSPMNSKEESSITVRFERTHQTILEFDLAVSGGVCEVIVNGKPKYYMEQFVKISEDLMVGINNISISFIPSSTSKSYVFNVMRLAIKNFEVKSYKVDYVGKIGETNPTINYLINMLSVCGDSIESIQRTVAHATPTVQALNQLRVYFDLHHEEKLKGKRLITKH